MKTLNRDDLLYWSGLIDGDGSFVAQMVRRPGYVFGFQIRLTVQISQRKKRRHHLEKICDTIGHGYVRDRGDMSDYILTETKMVYEFLKQIAPFVRIKTKQVNLVIQIIEQLPSSKNSPSKFLDLCRISDHVAELNDSKNREITAEVVENWLKDKKLI
jgi:intein-encoded DNA endonuclease-like protein